MSEAEQHTNAQKMNRLPGKLTGLFALVLSLSLFLCPCKGISASFDCAKATTRIEKMICDDAELSKLDEELNFLYLKALKKFPGLDSIKQNQWEWLMERNNCISSPRPKICINTKYRGRIAELDPYDVNYKLPILVKDLGENWQYKRDADKLPVIREAMASGRLKAPPPIYNTPPICKTFPEDLITGRNIEVIEPDMQIMDRDDPQLGEQRYKDLGEKGVRVLPRDDSRVGRWYRCDGIDPPESTPSNPNDIFTWFKREGLLPYRIYQTELDGKIENGPEDVLLYRGSGNGYSHDYLWVDLKGCEIKRRIQVYSPAHRLHPDNKDALSLMIYYKDKPFVLQYVDWSKKNDSKKLEEVILQSLISPRVCSWGDPFNTKWKINIGKKRDGFISCASTKIDDD